MRFHALDVQGKSKMLTRTLLDAGHEESTPAQADLLLIDIDDPDAPRRGRLIEQCAGKVMLYPHGGMPSTYHGFYEPDDRIDIQLVHGAGGARLVSELGRQVATVGWSYSPMLPLKTVVAPARVLFGPTHPYGSGKLDQQDKKMNLHVYEILRESGLAVEVQMFGTAVANGLPQGVNGYRSTLMLDWAAVDRAELVVAEGTLACLAMARGKPVIMFGQDLEPTDEHSRPVRGPVIKVPRYPIDIDDGDLDELIDAACNGVGESWRHKFVGGPFDRAAFLNAVDSLLAVAV